MKDLTNEVDDVIVTLHIEISDIMASMMVLLMAIKNSMQEAYALK